MSLLRLWLIAAATPLLGDPQPSLTFWPLPAREGHVVSLEIPGSNPMQGSSVEVARRQADGYWRYVIRNPWGDAHIAAS